MQPTQQQGRFWPSKSSSTVRMIRLARVFSCFASSTQQINSFRAIGVRLSQMPIMFFVKVSTLTKSAGISCTRPPEIFVFINFIYQLRPTCQTSTKPTQNQIAAVLATIANICIGSNWSDLSLPPLFQPTHKRINSTHPPPKPWLFSPPCLEAAHPKGLVPLVNHALPPATPKIFRNLLQKSFSFNGLGKAAKGREGKWKKHVRSH